MLAGATRATHRLGSAFLGRNMSTSSTTLHQRPRDWKSVPPSAPPGSLTFSAQLPKLPVVDLQETLSRLKQTLKPLSWSQAEYDSVENKIDEFALARGPQLQERLLNHAEQLPHWLEGWWDDAAYLGYRDSVRPLSCLFPHPHLDCVLRSSLTCPITVRCIVLPKNTCPSMPCRRI